MSAAEDAWAVTYEDRDDGRVVAQVLHRGIAVAESGICESREWALDVLLLAVCIAYQGQIERGQRLADDLFFARRAEARSRWHGEAS